MRCRVRTCLLLNAFVDPLNCSRVRARLIHCALVGRVRSSLGSSVEIATGAKLKLRRSLSGATTAVANLRITLSCTSLCVAAVNLKLDRGLVWSGTNLKLDRGLVWSGRGLTCSVGTRRTLTRPRLGD